MKIEDMDTDYILRFMDQEWKKVCQAGKENDEYEKDFHAGMLYAMNAVVSEFGMNRNNAIYFDEENGRHYLVLGKDE